MFNYLNQSHNVYGSINLKVIRTCDNLIKELIFAVEKKQTPLEKQSLRTTSLEAVSPLHFDEELVHVAAKLVMASFREEGNAMPT